MDIWFYYHYDRNLTLHYNLTLFDMLHEIWGSESSEDVDIVLPNNNAAWTCTYVWKFQSNILRNASV
jgi:hypothetical protein